MVRANSRRVICKPQLPGCSHARALAKQSRKHLWHERLPLLTAGALVVDMSGLAYTVATSTRAFLFLVAK